MQVVAYFQVFMLIYRTEKEIFIPFSCKICAVLWVYAKSSYIILHCIYKGRRKTAIPYLLNLTQHNAKQTDEMVCLDAVMFGVNHCDWQAYVSGKVAEIKWGVSKIKFGCMAYFNISSRQGGKTYSPHSLNSNLVMAEVHVV